MLIQENDVKALSTQNMPKLKRKLTLFLTIISGNDARSQSIRNSRKTLIKYCVCAWGLPAVFVVTCFALDYTDTVSIDYGMRERNLVECYIYNI